MDHALHITSDRCPPSPFSQEAPSGVGWLMFQIPWVPDCSSHFLVEVGMGVPRDGERKGHIRIIVLRSVPISILSSVLHHAAS